jgi:phosphatidylinositol alpha-1,6-mannosyltransferase
MRIGTVNQERLGGGPAVDLLIALEQKFARSPDGAIWTDSMYARRFWDRYLTVFDRVRVLARVQDVDDSHVRKNHKRVDGDRVSFTPVPFYVGPLGFAKGYLAIRRAIAAALVPGEAVILRVPGTIGTIAAGILRARGQPFSLEVVGDPWEGFGPSANHHPLRPFFRIWSAFELKRQCRRARVVLYVTQQALQARYPCRDASPGSGHPETIAHAVSDVEMGDDAYGGTGLRKKTSQPWELVCVASMEQPYKGLDILLRAVAVCTARGERISLTLLGDGRERRSLERLASELGLARSVHFKGWLPAGSAVQAFLDLPSRVEGLPRALIEAMGRGLPCVSTSVGGIPELLPSEALVTPGDVDVLADRITACLASGELRSAMGKANLARALEYRDSVLQPRREAFLRGVRDATQADPRRSEPGSRRGDESAPPVGEEIA